MRLWILLLFLLCLCLGATAQDATTVTAVPATPPAPPDYSTAKEYYRWGEQEWETAAKAQYDKYLEYKTNAKNWHMAADTAHSGKTTSEVLSSAMYPGFVGYNKPVVPLVYQAVGTGSTSDYMQSDNLSGYGPYSRRTRSASSTSDEEGKTEHVSGYTRRNGTYVAPYYRHPSH